MCSATKVQPKAPTNQVVAKTQPVSAAWRQCLLVLSKAAKLTSASHCNHQTGWPWWRPSMERNAVGQGQAKLAAWAPPASTAAATRNQALRDD